MFGQKLDTLSAYRVEVILSFRALKYVFKVKIRHFYPPLVTRAPDFSVSGIKIHVFGQKLDTSSATRAEPNLAFRALNGNASLCSDAQKPLRVYFGLWEFIFGFW